MSHHQQVTVTVGEQSAEVDARLAPLIEELWKAGMQTWQSCERHVATKKVWINFVTAADAEAFLDVVVGGEGSTKWSRAEYWYFGEYEPIATPMPAAVAEPHHPEGWEFHATAQDLRLGTGKPPAFCISIAVLFPRKDLKRVIERLQAWNAANPEGTA